jgi:biopolymer transport protein ExbD
MKAGGEAKPYDDINITPMLDLAYVLLVIFIIMTTASVQGIKVNLPKAGDSVSLGKPKTVAVSITNDGKIFMNTIPVTLAELEDKLRQQKAIDPDFPVVVKGDGEVQYKAVMDVLAVLGRVNVTQLGLATQKLVQ